MTFHASCFLSYKRKNNECCAGWGGKGRDMGACIIIFHNRASVEVAGWRWEMQSSKKESYLHKAQMDFAGRVRRRAFSCNLFGCWKVSLPVFHDLKINQSLRKLSRHRWMSLTCCWCAICSWRYLMMVVLKSLARLISKRSISRLISAEMSSNSFWHRWTFVSHCKFTLSSLLSLLHIFNLPPQLPSVLVRSYHFAGSVPS